MATLVILTDRLKEVERISVVMQNEALSDSSLDDDDDVSLVEIAFLFTISPSD